MKGETLIRGGLLVSVRSTEEARVALEGGATWIDVKEPRNGPLGRASPRVWRAVRAVVPVAVAFSVALGELPEHRPPILMANDLQGVEHAKVGLAGVGPDWREQWSRLRDSLPKVRWVAVAYRDHLVAGSPCLDDVLAEAIAVGSCVGALIDTWRKSGASLVEGKDDDRSWVQGCARSPVFERFRESGKFLSLAGGLDLDAISGLREALAPDWFAVRGAACARGDRLGRVELHRVQRLAAAAAGSSLPQGPGPE